MSVLRGKWVSLHVLVGCLAGLPACLVVLSGIALGTQPALRHRGAPWTLAAPVTEARRLPWLITTALASFPGREVDAIFPPQVSDRALWIRYAKADPKAAFFDPSTGALTARLSDEYDGVWLWLYRFHRGKLLGSTGQAIVTLLALACVALFISGMLVRRKRARGRGALGWHVAFGDWVGALFCGFAITGAVLNYYVPVASALDPLPAPPAAATGGFSFERALREARAVSGSALEAIYFPKRAGEPMLFYFVNGDRAYVDAGSGKLLKARTWQTHWTGWLFPLHSGKWLGARGAWIPAGAGCLFLMLLGSGMILGYRRLVPRKALREGEAGYAIIRGTRHVWRPPFPKACQVSSPREPPAERAPFGRLSRRFTFRPEA